MELLEGVLVDFEKRGIHRLASDDLKIMPVEVEALPHDPSELEHLVDVLAADDGVHVKPQPGVAMAELFEKLQAFERAVVIAGNASDAIMGLANPVEREVQVDA